MDLIDGSFVSNQEYPPRILGPSPVQCQGIIRDSKIYKKKKKKEIETETET